MYPQLERLVTAIEDAAESATTMPVQLVGEAGNHRVTATAVALTPEAWNEIVLAVNEVVRVEAAA